MAFEYSTIDDIRKLLAGINEDVQSLTGLRQQLWPQMKDDVTVDRILITETANFALTLSGRVAKLGEIVADFIASEAQLRGADSDSGFDFGDQPSDD